MMRVGAQLYTLREYCKTLDDFALTLRRVADMGYSIVQVSGSCAFEADWLKKELDRNGLQCVLTHTPAPRILGETQKVCEEHDIFGCRYIGLGKHNFEPEKGDAGYRYFLSEYVPAAKIMRDNGKYFMYHNHDGEFAKLNGRLIIEQLMEDVASDLMGFTLDTYWVQVGGGDPAQWLEKLSGRIPCIHLKDYGYGRTMLPIGEGNLNWERIFEKAESGGTEYMLVEQDHCNGEDPFDCLNRSLQYLRACGFES